MGHSGKRAGHRLVPADQLETVRATSVPKTKDPPVTTHDANLAPSREAAGFQPAEPTTQPRLTTNAVDGLPVSRLNEDAPACTGASSCLLTRRRRYDVAMGSGAISCRSRLPNAISFTFASASCSVAPVVTVRR